MTALIDLPADLHLHSCLSPCAANSMVPPNVVGILKRLDVEIFSVTDHNSCGNARAFREAARGEDMIFLPGAELQTVEEVHLLTYFPTVERMELFFARVVSPTYPSHSRGAGTFGDQYLVDENGNFIGESEEMLALPLNIGLDKLAARVRKYGGVPVPAHMDRRFGIPYQLGFVPPSLELEAVEISNLNRVVEIKEELLSDRDVTILSSSDAHDLNTFAMPKMELSLKERTPGECIEAVRGSEGRGVELISPEAR